MPVSMELRRIISSTSETQDQHFIILKEVEGERSFPIVIGLFEVTSIERRIKGLVSQRPLTHDLIVQAVELLGGEFQDVFISDLREGTYFAKVRIMQDGEMVELDCRPSDAIAIAVQARLPILVAEQVIAEASDETNQL